MLLHTYAYSEQNEVTGPTAKWAATTWSPPTAYQGALGMRLVFTAKTLFSVLRDLTYVGLLFNNFPKIQQVQFKVQFKWIEAISLIGTS